MNIVQTIPTGVIQPEPPEGRKAFPLAQPPINFVTGNEVFEWQSNSLGSAGNPKAILGAWVDATGMSGLAATDGITITFNGGNGNSQSFFVPSGSQGYVVPVQQTPVNVSIKANTSTGLAIVTLYNYNPLFTGVGAGAAPAVTNAGSQSGQTGTASGRNSPHTTRQFPIQRP